MAVAVVIMAAKVMAMAPTIGDIPSPVVGDNETATPANTFVFPDAIDLTAFVTDMNAGNPPTVNDPANIMWSYEIMGGTARYRINNRDQLAPTDDPANPPAAKRIDGPGSADDDPLGTNDPASAITIRNIALSPIGGPNVDPGAAGIIPAETQEVTLYAGDGTTFSWKAVLFYTDNDGVDRLSGGGGPPPVEVYNQTFTNTVGNFAYALLGGAATSSYDSANGALCISTVASGDNLGLWTGPYGVLPLVKNKVYKIRAQINTSQSDKTLVPFWDLIINSFVWDNPTAPNRQVKGLNLYGGNYMFLSNTGNANAAVGGSTTDFLLYYCPSPMLTAQWNDESEGAFPTGPGPFAPSQAGVRDASMEFRILDAASNTGTNSAQALGTLCLTALSIHTHDYADLTMGANKMDFQTITQGGLNGASGSGNTRATVLVGATASFANGAVTITPTQNTGLTLVEPGDYNFDLVGGNSVVDNYPAAMTPQTLYQIQVTMSAPTTGDENAPPDIIFLGADTPTNELINLSYVTNNAWHHAMPKTGTPQTYTAFFYSNYGTAASNQSWFKQFRWRMMIGSNADLGGGGEPNTGAVRVHSAKIDEVSF
jgi:hypothetical protein